MASCYVCRDSITGKKPIAPSACGEEHPCHKRYTKSSYSSQFNLGHVFCEPCLLKVCRATTPPRCPMCRKEFSVPTGITPFFILSEDDMLDTPLSDSDIKKLDGIALEFEEFKKNPNGPDQQLWLERAANYVSELRDRKWVKEVRYI